MKLLLRMLQVAIIVAPIALAGWLLWQNLAPSGVFGAQYFFGGRHLAWISDLTPGYRTGPLTQVRGKLFFRAVAETPVYVLLRPPRTFQFVTVGVLARVHGEDFQIGARVGATALDNVFETPRIEEPASEDGFVLYEATFPLSVFYREPDKRLRVAFRATGANAHTPLFDVAGITIRYVDPR